MAETTRYGREEIEAAWAEYQQPRRRRPTTGRHGRRCSPTTPATRSTTSACSRASRRSRTSSSTMKEYPSMTLWIEWAAIDGDHIALLHLEQPARPDGHRAALRVPQHDVPRVRRRRQVQLRGRLLQPGRRRAGLRRVAEGRRPQAHAAGPLAPGHRRLVTPSRRRRPSPAKRSRPSSTKYRKRGELAVATGDWDQWADQFTDDAHYREHHFGYFTRPAARSATGSRAVMQPFPTMEFPVKWSHRSTATGSAR